MGAKIQNAIRAANRFRVTLNLPACLYQWSSKRYVLEYFWILRIYVFMKFSLYCLCMKLDRMLLLHNNTSHIWEVQLNY